MKNVKVAHPYTQDDKDLLFQLINTYPIIETKKTDATSIKKKSDAWSKVTSEYNSCGRREKRSVIQLKRCWDKMKRKRKGDIGLDESRKISPASKDLITSYIDDTMANTCDPIISKLNENVRCKQKNEHVSDDVNSNSDNDYAKRLRKPKCVSGVDRLLECRIKNTIVERERSEQIHNLQLEIEKEKLKQAIADRQAAEMNAQMKKVQLEEHMLQLKMLKKQFQQK